MLIYDSFFRCCSVRDNQKRNLMMLLEFKYE